MKNLIACFLLLLCCDNLVAQDKVEDTVKAVVIAEKKIVRQAATQNIEPELKAYFQNAAMQQLLQLNTNIFVKNYAPGGLSTISIRGSSAAQTQVLWHGVPVQNPANGLSDFSGLPVSFFDQIQIQYGTQLNGSGIGGAVVLSNSQPYFVKKQSFSFQSSYESLQNATMGVEWIQGGKRIFNQLKVQASDAGNSYTYYNPDRQQNEELRHAHAAQQQVMNNLHVKINGANTISLSSWIQGVQRDIPAATFESGSRRRESMQVFRFLLAWDKRRVWRWQLNSRLGYFSEHYQYIDSAIELNNEVPVFNIPYQVSLSFQASKRQLVQLQAFGNYSAIRQRKDADLYKSGVLISYKVDRVLKIFNAKASLQKEFTNVFSVPLVGAIQIEAPIMNGVKCSGSISSNYRMPTLNELYYLPGGNINLKPEISRNFEAGLQFIQKKKRHHFEADFGVYHRRVRNWITWFGGAILTPHNIQKVWSRGLECMMTYTIDLKKPTNETEPKEIQIVDERTLEEANKRSRARMQLPHKLSVGILYAYSLSTTLESAIPNDYSIGKQLPYVPRYQFKPSVAYQFRNFEFRYIHTYTGYRFVSTDESQYLKPYLTGNLILAQQFKLKTGNIRIDVRLQNLFDQSYEGMAGRVMPGRNYTLGLTYSIQRY